MDAWYTNMIHLILGKQGSGKTLLLVKKAYEMHRKGRNIYSNLALNFKSQPLNYQDVLDCSLSNGAVLLDEIHQLLPARRSLQKRNVDICDNFLSMVRKQGLEVYGTTQTPRKVDVRFREEADYVYVCEKYIYDYKLHKWVKYLHNQNLSKDVPMMISVTVTETFSNTTIKTAFIGNRFFDMYDTNEIIKVTGI